MLVGREPESARIDAVLEAARNHVGSALVVRGEAGIGKTALLEAAIERAGDLRVLRALGVESEVEIPFSGLHELLGPILRLLREVPNAQADALRAALALGHATSPDRLAVFGGALSVIAAAAQEEALLCVVDDAHWLDDASAEAIAFVARRINADGIALLFAVREPAPRPFSVAGVEELGLMRLDRSAARALAVRFLPAGTSPLVVEQLIEQAAGIPLALQELAAAVAATPPGERDRARAPIEQGFVRRFAALPTSTKRALILLAASDVRGLRTIRTALAALDLGVEDLTPAQDAGLLTRTSGRVEFCHPLARSAIYEGADEAERYEAHRVLATTATGVDEADRRAWHLAATATGPDEVLASALDEAADSARRRGGVSAEARAVERAARLTPDPGLRARRLVRAGDAAYRAGRLELAEALLEEAVQTGLELSDLATAQARRAYLWLERGDFDAALELMVGGANKLAEEDSCAAARLLTNAATVLYHRLELDAGTALAERAWQLAGDAAIHDAELCHIVSFQRLLVGRVREGMDLAWHCASLVENDREGRVVVADAASTLLYGGEVKAARRLLTVGLLGDRAMGAIGDLGYTLHMSAQAEWYAGELESAYTRELEATQIVEELGAAQVLDDCRSRLSAFEAALGRHSDSLRHGQEALSSAIRLGDRRNEIRSRGALGLLALSQGDAEAAVAQLAPAVAALDGGGHRNPNHFRIHPDLVEAHVRLGHVRPAQQIVRSLERSAQATGVAWTSGAAMRCRGLLETDDAAAATLFERALRLHERAGIFERARTQLCFGEQLRRRGRRRDARVHLRAALECFDAAGATPWTERARDELRASGLTLRRRTPESRDSLTPQELRIARLVAEGKTNRDVAASLFVTPKTVEFHLTSVYRKLAISSRSELVRLASANHETLAGAASGGAHLAAPTIDQVP